MNLIIKSDEAQKLATRLAEASGESIDQVVVEALREKADRELQSIPTDRSGIAEKLMELGRRYSQLPDKDARTADEILGYDENGLPT